MSRTTFVVAHSILRPGKAGTVIDLAQRMVADFLTDCRHGGLSSREAAIGLLAAVEAIIARLGAEDETSLRLREFMRQLEGLATAHDMAAQDAAAAGASSREPVH